MSPRPEPRQPAREELRTRKRKGNVDPFHIDPERIPDGITYEWKRASVFGSEDIDHQMAMRENAWEPVPADRHPEYMPAGYKGAITRAGMVLMERPAYLTEEARQEERQAAAEIITNNEQALQMEHASHAEANARDARVAPRISRSMSAIEVPE